MSEIDRLLDAAWAQTDMASPSADNISPARSQQAFALSVMEAIARRRLRADLATRFAIVIAVLAAGSALAPVLAQVQNALVSGQGAGALTVSALIVAAAVSVSAAVRRWPATLARA